MQLILSLRSLRLSSLRLTEDSLHFFYFILLFSSYFYHSIIQLTSASGILLVIPSRVFLISVIVLFVSVCLFFYFNRSLLIDTCIFSILFFQVLDHLYYHYSEFFFRQSAYFLFIYLDLYVSRLFLHLHIISLFNYSFIYLFLIYFV